MLHAYFDESFTGGITAIAGYVAPTSVWEAIEGPWKEVLALYKDKGVRSFDAAHCAGEKGYGEFALVDAPGRDHILHSLSGILQNSELQPVWSAVLTRDWNNVVRDQEFREKFPKPFHLCFEHIARQLSAWARKHAAGELTAPMFARQQEYQEWMTFAVAAYGQYDWYKMALGPIAFGYPDQVIPLQCADMLAHEMSWEWERLEYGASLTLQTLGTRRLLERASGLENLNVGGCFNASALSVAVERFKRTGQPI